MVQGVTQTAAAGVDSNQDVSASQLLQELEQLVPEPDAAAEAIAGGGAVVRKTPQNVNSHTPSARAPRARDSTRGLTSSAKRRRRELKSLFGGQDGAAEQQVLDCGVGGGTIQHMQVSISQ